jgi:hypothetical protein
MSIVLLVAALCLSFSANAAELKGVVKSEDGKPLAGVEVLTYAPAGPAAILGRQVASRAKNGAITYFGTSKEAAKVFRQHDRCSLF